MFIYIYIYIYIYRYIYIHIDFYHEALQYSHTNQGFAPVTIIFTIGSVSLFLYRYLQNIDFTPAVKGDLHHHNQIFSYTGRHYNSRGKCPHKTKEDIVQTLLHCSPFGPHRHAAAEMDG